MPRPPYSLSTPPSIPLRLSGRDARLALHRESGPAAPVRLTLTYAGGASTSFSLPGADVKRLAEFLAGAVGEGGT